MLQGYCRCRYTAAGPPVLRPVVRTLIAHLQGFVGTAYLLAVAPHERLVTLVQVVDEAIPALVGLREKGVVRHIGITGLPLDVFRKVLDR
jgi:hypothetical protein